MEVDGLQDKRDKPYVIRYASNSKKIFLYIQIKLNTILKMDIIIPLFMILAIQKKY